MNLTARINPEYAIRTAAVALMLLGFGLWALYDGCVAYPRTNQEFATVRAELLNLGGTPETLLLADNNGVRPIDRAYQAQGLKASKKPVKELEEIKEKTALAKGVDSARVRDTQLRLVQERLAQPLHSPNDILVQFAMVAVFAPLGLFFLFRVLIRASRRYAAGDDGLHGFRAAPVPYDALVGLDKARWHSKGIARIAVEKNGRPAWLILDDWHYRGMTAILAEIERRRPDLATAAEAELQAAVPPPPPPKPPPF